MNAYGGTPYEAVAQSEDVMKATKCGDVNLNCALNTIEDVIKL